MCSNAWTAQAVRAIISRKADIDIKTRTQMNRTKDKPVRKDPASPRTIQKQPRELRHVFRRRTEATSRWLPMMFDDPADGGFDSRRRHQ